MTLEEYLHEVKPPCIATIIFDMKGEMLVNNYNCNEYASMSKELLRREVMETNEEEECVEVYLYE